MDFTKSEYERIFYEYGDSLYRVVYCYCKNKADSEDVLQNTFLKLYLSNEKFESENHIKNWLYKVAINNALNIRKSRWHSFQEIPEDYQEYEYSFVFDEIIDINSVDYILINGEKYESVN